MGGVILIGDCIEGLRRFHRLGIQAQVCVTSPPYFGLRDYGHSQQIGLEPTPDEFVNKLVEVFREVHRVLKDDGTLWLNLGDSFNAAGRKGHGSRQGYKQGTNRASANGTDSCRPSVKGLKPKDLIGIPWRVAFALQADGWYLRSDIIWSKPNPMPESVTDRPTKAHEYLFLLSKSERYYYNHEAVKEPSTGQTGKAASFKRKTKEILIPNQTAVQHRLDRSDREDDGLRNRRSVWTVATQPCKEAHFATFPPKLIEPCILAGSKPGDIVLDPFMGSGTTAMVARDTDRRWIGCELNPKYEEIQKIRLGLK